MDDKSDDENKPVKDENKPTIMCVDDSNTHLTNHNDVVISLSDDEADESDNDNSDTIVIMKSDNEKCNDDLINDQKYDLSLDRSTSSRINDKMLSTTNHTAVIDTIDKLSSTGEETDSHKTSHITLETASVDIINSVVAPNKDTKEYHSDLATSPLMHVKLNGGVLLSQQDENETTFVKTNDGCNDADVVTSENAKSSQPSMSSESVVLISNAEDMATSGASDKMSEVSMDKRLMNVANDKESNDSNLEDILPKTLSANIAMPVPLFCIKANDIAADEATVQRQVPVPETLVTAASPSQVSDSVIPFSVKQSRMKVNDFDACDSLGTLTDGLRPLTDVDMSLHNKPSADNLPDEVLSNLNKLGESVVKFHMNGSHEDLDMLKNCLHDNESETAIDAKLLEIPIVVVNKLNENITVSDHVKRYQANKDKNQQERNSIQMLQCTLCPFTTPFPKRLEIHELRHQQSFSAYVCKICHYIAAGRIHLEKHVTSHGKYQTKTKNVADNTVTEIKGSHICGICPFRTKLKVVFEYHKKRHSMKSRFMCSFCGFGARTPKHLEQHLCCHKRKQSKTEEVAHRRKTKGSFECKICPFRTKHRPSFEIHKRRHNAKTRFVCGVCDYGALKFKHLEHHMRCHNKVADNTETKYLHVCRVCLFRTKSKHSFDIHNRRHSVKTKFMCAICNYGAFTFNHLGIHMRFHNNESYRKANRVGDSTITGTKGLHVCGICLFRTKLKLTFDIHKKRHGMKTKFMCSFCGFGARTRNHLEQHLCCHKMKQSKNAEVAHSRKTKGFYECQTCSFKTELELRFGIHKKRHNMKTNFMCDVCDYGARTPSNLEQHMTYHNKKEILKGKNKSPLKSLTTVSVGNSLYCKHCPYVAKFNFQLKKHTEHHGKKTNFMCSVCNFSCGQDSSLQAHLALHRKSDGSAVKFKSVLKCSYCEYKSGSAARVQIHEKCHQNKGKYPCHKCSFETSTVLGLRKHLQVHAGSLFCCAHCPFVTKVKVFLELHERRHRTKAKNMCHTCGYAAYQKSHLAIHMQLHKKSIGRKKVNQQSKKDDTSNSVKMVAQSRDKEIGIKLNPESHEKALPHKCQLCPFMCESLALFNLHKIRHGQKLKFQCPDCSFSAKALETIKKHSIWHKAESPLRCARLNVSDKNGCNLSKLSPANLKNGIVSQKHFYGSKENMLEIWRKKKLRHSLSDSHKTKIKVSSVGHKCPFCPFHNKSLDILVKHEMKHLQHGTFMCTICKFSSNKKAGLVKHWSLHNKSSETGMKLKSRNLGLLNMSVDDFKCSFCPYHTPDSILLAKHESKHEDKQGEFMCDICTYGASTHLGLFSHKNVHKKSSEARQLELRNSQFRPRRLRKQMLSKSSVKSLNHHSSTGLKNKKPSSVTLRNALSPSHRRRESHSPASTVSYSSKQLSRGRGRPRKTLKIAVSPSHSRHESHSPASTVSYSSKQSSRGSGRPRKNDQYVNFPEQGESFNEMPTSTTGKQRGRGRPKKWQNIPPNIYIDITQKDMVSNEITLQEEVQVNEMVPHVKQENEVVYNDSGDDILYNFCQIMEEGNRSPEKRVLSSQQGSFSFQSPQTSVEPLYASSTYFNSTSDVSSRYVSSTPSFQSTANPRHLTMSYPTTQLAMSVYDNEADSTHNSSFPAGYSYLENDSLGPLCPSNENMFHHSNFMSPLSSFGVPSGHVSSINSSFVSPILGVSAGGINPFSTIGRLQDNLGITASPVVPVGGPHRSFGDLHGNPGLLFPHPVSVSNSLNGSGVIAVNECRFCHLMFPNPAEVVHHEMTHINM